MAELSWGKVGTRAEAAALLRLVADGLEDGGEVELEQDGARLALKVPDKIAIEVEAEIDESSGESGLEIELKWSSRAPAKAAGPGRAKSGS